MPHTTTDPPANAYYNGLVGSSYDWHYTTVAQPGANNREITWPAGKLLGGSSAVNGMFQVRPSQLEIDTLAGLIGSDNFNWNSLYAAMKKGENFTAPDSAIQAEGGIQFTASSHGTTGMLHTTYPG